MAEDNVAEVGAAKAEVPAAADADVPIVPVPGPVAPVDMPAAAGTPKDVDPVSVAASAVGHLLIGFLIFGSLASAQKPPEAIPVKLIPADQAPQKLKKPVQPPQEKKQAMSAAQAASPPPPPKPAAQDPANKATAKASPDAAKATPPPKADSSAKTASQPWQDIASSLGIANYGRKTTVPDTLLAELSAEVKRCWTVPSGWTDPRQAAVTLRFLLNRDGTLDGDPAVVEFPATPVGAAAAKAAIAAVTQCGPYNLPAEQFEQWKDIQLKLTP
jgi:hypothetical protein